MVQGTHHPTPPHPTPPHPTPPHPTPPHPTPPHPTPPHPLILHINYETQGAEISFQSLTFSCPTTPSLLTYLLDLPIHSSSSPPSPPLYSRTLLIRTPKGPRKLSDGHRRDHANCPTDTEGTTETIRRTPKGPRKLSVLTGSPY